METKAFDNCPNCGTKIKSGLMSSVTLYSERAAKLINKYANQSQFGYCSKCGEQLYQEALAKGKDEGRMLRKRVSELIQQIPVITLQHPYNWQYKVIYMLTAQSTLGTGVFTDIASSFTDMMGGESKRYNEKVKAAENNCLMQLRLQAVELGANAVIAADIDYSEMGGAKSMVLVCMSGTAINVTNTEVISEGFAKNIDEIKESRRQITELLELVTENQN